MNTIIIKQFELLSQQLKYDIDNTSGKEQIINTYRLKNTLNIISILKKLTYEIKSGDDVKNIKGIGKHTVDRINEILKYGKLKELNKSKINNYESIIEELEQIYGVGRKLAIELHKKYGVISVNDLKERYKNKTIKLPDIVVKGLKYYDKIKTHIPRNEIESIYIYLLKQAFMINKLLHVIICGSFRRLKNFSNDIDILLTHRDNINLLNPFVEHLIKNKFIIESLTTSDVQTKYMGLCKFNNKPIRRIDIRFIPYESYYFAILYFTGSKNFNKHMRQIAIDKGYTLNEYGLWKNNKSIKVNSEKEIFDILDMEYLQPNLREF